MDFPIDLNKGSSTFLRGMDEWKQNFEVLFCNSIHTFLQDYALGSQIPEHSDESMVKYGIEQTLIQVPNTELLSCEFNRVGNDLYVRIQVLYRNNEVSLTLQV